MIGLTPATTRIDVADAIAPTLDSPTGHATSQTTGAGSVNTDEGNGILYWFVSTSQTAPNAVNLKSGTGANDFGNQPVVNAGSQAVDGGFSGLASEVLHYVHYLHQDAGGNESAIATSPAFFLWGGELVVNGGFDSDSNWTKGAGWSISSGSANKTPGNGDSVRQDISMSAGQILRVTFQIKNYVSGSFQPRLLSGSAVSGTSRSGNGTYTEDLTAQSGNDRLGIVGFSTAEGSVDNVSVYRVG